MYMKLKTLRLECGGCPTNYTGETVDGKTVEMYLRHGSLWIEVDGERIVHEHAGALDGVCGLEDFRHYAKRNGYLLDTEDATFTSSIQELEETIQSLYGDKIWVRIVKDFYSPSADVQLKKDELRTVELKAAQTLLNTGLAVVNSEHDQEKLDKYLQETKIKG